jgi:hypothetical protein
MIVELLTRPSMVMWIRIVRAVLCANLVIGLVIVRLSSAAQAPSTAATQLARDDERILSLSQRVKVLEDMRAGERLAVLDNVQREGHETKLVSYGTALTLVGTLLLGIITRKVPRKDTLDVDALVERLRDAMVK